MNRALVQVIRSAAAIAVGFGIFAGSLRLIPIAAEKFDFDYSSSFTFLLLTVTVAIVSALIAGFLTGWIAGKFEIPHASAVGCLMVGLAVYSMHEQAVQRPGWYQIAVSGCGPISAIIGAAVRMLIRLKSAERQTLSAAQHSQ